MDILFLGYTVPKECAYVFSGASIAGNKMQWNLVHHLGKIDDIKICCISVLPIATWPHDTIFSRSQVLKLDERITSNAVSFCNLPILKQISQAGSVYMKARKYIKEHPDAIVLSFNLFPQIGIPMRILKQQYPKIKTVSLLADLPIDDTKGQRSVLSKMLRRLFDQSTWKSISNCESFIVLNEYVAKQYLSKKTSIVIEGGVDEDDLNTVTIGHKKSEKRNIVFAGALTEYNGITVLIDAVGRLPSDNIILDIYGDGPLKAYVQNAANKDKRLHYHGRVANDIVLRAQKSAWLLINPRKTDDLISKVTFPSKTFEYMLSGTPVLSTKLNGYSQEYLEHMFIAEDDTAEGIAKEIHRIECFPREILQKKADNARNFIIKNKSWKIQALNIYNFLCYIDKNK